jgi:hypothetical protein
LRGTRERSEDVSAFPSVSTSTLVVAETRQRVTGLLAHAGTHLDSELVVVVGSALESGTGVLLVTSDVTGTVVVDDFLGVLGQVESLDHTARTTTGLGGVTLAWGIAREGSGDSLDLSIGSGVGTLAGVTVLNTGPLVAKLGTRDLTSVDSLRNGVRSSPVLETGSL